MTEYAERNSAPLAPRRNAWQRAMLYTLSLVTLTIACLPVDARIIHRERSLYSTILVDQQDSIICLQFSVRKDQRNQSCMDRRAPLKMVFPYARMMMLALLMVPEPDRILVVGLGGGTLPVALNQLYPEAQVDIVEIDPAVKTVAETYFDFRENDRMQVILKDARVFTKRALTGDDRYDLIMLDAFNGDYIPEHLLTTEYLEETKGLLRADGVVAANTFAISRLYDHESNTYRAVFGPFYNVRSRTSANRIILAGNGPLPTLTELAETGRELGPRLAPYAVRASDYLPGFSTEADWDETARILTDQYSPANLLNNQ